MKMFSQDSTFFQLKRYPFQRVHPIAQIFLGTLFIILLAQIRIPLFFTPVPIALHSLSIMLIGAVLGSKKGACSALLYISGAALGLPILAGWKADPSFLTYPSAGYLIGFVVEAYVIGFILERVNNSKVTTTILALSTGAFCQLCIGTMWLAMFVGAQNAIWMGFTPFIVIEACKIMAVTAYLTAWNRVRA